MLAVAGIKGKQCYVRAQYAAISHLAIARTSQMLLMPRITLVLALLSFHMTPFPLLQCAMHWQMLALQFLAIPG